MRKLLGGLATCSVALLATAGIVGCQQGLGNGGADESAVPADRAANEVALQPGEQGQVEEILELCGWGCKSFAEGEVNISGIRKLDAFFSASARLQAEAVSLEAEVKAELFNMAAALGIEGAAQMSIDQLTAAIDAEVSGGFDGMIDGGITIAFAPPKCEVTASASLEAAAKCDASVDPGMATVECSGGCEAEASAMASCEGEAKLTCKGTAPSFACTGTCTGSCELEASAKCEGECKGTCEMDGSAACDGECMGDTDNGGNCTGECKLNAGASCEGSCKGSCELSAGGTCDGQCKGECEYDPGGASCEAGATAKCEATGSAKVECNGKCDGEVTPPMVEADCQATAKAEAQFAAECHPPSIDIKYNLTAEANAELSGDVDAKAAFEGKVQAVGKAFANIAAKGAKIEGVVRAGGGLVTAGADAVKDAAAAIGGDADAKLVVGGYCALQAMGEVEAALSSSVNSLEATGSAVASITATFGGS